MPYYSVYNCYPSFTDTFLDQDGTTVRTNPVVNYGGLGDHLQDYFVNRLTETPAARDEHLAAFLASDKSLTGIMAADLTGMANSLSVSYGITGTSTGFALLDFRGNSWRHLLGDGIVGESNTGSAAYTSTSAAAVTILNHFKNRYPSIKWAYAGLPHLPRYTCFAPNGATAFSWAPSLTNTAGGNNHWHPLHVTGTSYGESIFNWTHTPTNLQNFYKTNAIDRVKSILDASGWACPDINPNISNETTFGIFTSSIVENHMLTRAVVGVGLSYAATQTRNFPIVPLVSSTLRSREAHYYDDLSGEFTNFGYAQGVSGTAIEFVHGFTGASSAAADATVSLAYLRAGMLEPAAAAGAVGFVYRDNLPLLVELACTGATPAAEEARQAVQRARKFVAKRVYGTNDISVLPWSTLKNELKAHFSTNTIAPQLRTIAESIPVGSNNWASLVAGGDPANTGGASQEVATYESPNWPSGTSEQNLALPSSFPVCPCPEPPTGSCCQNASCADGVKQADCAGSWSETLTCAQRSGDSNCAEQPINCCIPNVGCSVTTPSACAAAGGSQVAACLDCCEGLPAGACVCVTISKIDTFDPQTGDPCTKFCKEYGLLPNPCCCRPGTSPPGACFGGQPGGSIAEQLNCDQINDQGGVQDCPGVCGTTVSVSPDLCACCGFQTAESPPQPCCSNTQNNGAGICLFVACNTPVSNGCEPITTLLANPNIPDDAKQSVLQDLTELLGTTLVQSLIENQSQNTAFRSQKSVTSTLDHYKTLEMNPHAIYANFVGNYTPTVATVERIKSEYAFDRLFIPIAYT